MSEPFFFAPLQRGKYRAIMLDPPWRFSAGTKGRPQHYPRMTDVEIAALPVAELAHPDGCFVFVWVTSPKAHQVHKIVEGWSRRGLKVRYSSRAFVWVKLLASAAKRGATLFFLKDEFHTGHGYTTRKNAEDCLLFKIGSPKRIRKDIRELLFSPLREHSRKPDEAYERVQQFCDGPYAEVFARESRVGWETFGNEAQKFDLPLVATAALHAEAA